MVSGADFGPQLEASSAAIQRALSGEAAGGGLSPERTAELFRVGVEQPALRRFEEFQRPEIERSFARLGSTFSTRRGLAVSRASGRLQEDLNANLARTQLSNQQLNAQLQERALGRSLQAGILTSPLSLGTQLQEFGTPFQAFEQARLNRAASEFIRTSPENNPLFSQSLNFTGQNQSATTTGRSTAAQIGILAAGALTGGLAGAAFAGAGGAGAFG